MRNRTRWGCVVLGSILVCLAASSSSLAQTENGRPQPDTAAFVALLEKSAIITAKWVTTLG